MLNATRREFERGYRKHGESCGDSQDASERLLLFYAVECGLKALIMRDHRVDESSKLPPDKQMMHDLREGLKLAHAPATLTLRQVMTRGQKVAQVVLPKDLHQAFRYGILVEHEAEVTDELTQALEWLKGRLG